MHATNLIGVIPESGEGPISYYSKVNLDGYFMFRQTDSSDFNDMRARVLLSRRGRGRRHDENLYQRFNSERPGA